MANQKPKRSPLANAPTSDEIMSRARRRTPKQQNSIPVSQHNGIPANRDEKKQTKPKATFYLRADLLKILKRYAVEIEETQSRIVESAIEEYMENHPFQND